MTTATSAAERLKVETTASTLAATPELADLTPPSPPGLRTMAKFLLALPTRAGPALPGAVLLTMLALYLAGAW